MGIVDEKEIKVNSKIFHLKLYFTCFFFLNSAFHPVPQPIIIHTNSPNYQPQHPQQQAPSPQPQLPAQIWHSENYPMLPQPSAPPRPTDDSYMDRAPQRPTDDSYMDRPPPYEKICAT